MLQPNPVMKFYLCCQQAFSPVSPGFSLHLLNMLRQVKAAEVSLDSARLDIQYGGTQSMLGFVLCSSSWEPAQTSLLRVVRVCMIKAFYV